MLQLVQVTSAPSAVSVSMRTAVSIVMCRHPAMRAPLSGCAFPNSSRSDMSPGISCSAIPISLRPQLARSRFATLLRFVSISILLSILLRHDAACHEQFERVVAAFFSSIDLRDNLELLPDETGPAEIGHELVAGEAEPHGAL